MTPSVRLHSIHNPEREAERFVESAFSNDSPVFIVVSEPGESWIARSLKKKFPSSILIALRYSTSCFMDSDVLWHYVWRPNSHLSVSSFLFTIIPDEYLPLTQFIPWKPSDSVWPKESILVWKEISDLIKKQQSIMYTRIHFGNKWLNNIFRNCLYMKKIRTSEYTQKKVLLAAAGPSLETFFPFNTSNMFVCAVSSALSCLKHHNCTPDICIATDGGFWALDHFKNLNTTVPVCFPLEAAIPSRVLQNNPLVLLNYGSALESFLLSMLKIQNEKIERNGTVAGTAASYLLTHTSDSVFVTGLDLCESLAFPHARPHSSDLITNSNYRLNSIANILYERNISTKSFLIYRNWFSTRDVHFKSRFFRIRPVLSEIPGIKEIEKEHIKKSVVIPVKNDSPLIYEEKMFDLEKRKKILLSFLKILLREIQLLRKPDYFICATDVQEKSHKSVQCSATLEFLQMVSYTDYIDALKKTQNLNTSENATGADSLHILCEAGIAFIEKLTSMVRSMTW